MKGQAKEVVRVKKGIVVKVQEVWASGSGWDCVRGFCFRLSCYEA